MSLVNELWIYMWNNTIRNTIGSLELASSSTGIPDEVGKNLALVFVEGACSSVNVTRVDFGRIKPLSCASI